MITTTLKDIRRHQPCKGGWERLLAHLGKTKADDEPLAMTVIFDLNGLDDALWCLRALGPEHHKLIVGLACDFAEQALPYVAISEARRAECLRTVRMWIAGEATIGDVKIAADAAWDAAMAVWPAAGAAWDAAMAVWAAGAAWDAAMAVWAAADAAVAAAAADAAVAASAVAAVAREWQANRFREVMTGVAQ